MILLLIVAILIQTVCQAKGCASDCIDKGGFYCDRKCCTKLQCSKTCKANLNDSKPMRYFTCPLDKKQCGESNTRIIKGAALTTTMILEPNKPLKKGTHCAYVIKFD